jgi:hypothetical protein
MKIAPLTWSQVQMRPLDQKDSTNHAWLLTRTWIHRAKKTRSMIFWQQMYIHDIVSFQKPLHLANYHQPIILLLFLINIYILI